MSKRAWILPLTAALLTGLAPARPIAAAERVVSGVVYLDKNHNGRPDPGEGLPGVRVTDSVQFVETAADGAYRIAVSDDPLFPYKPAQVVSVSWPSGTWPAGAWWARLDQIADTQHVDFALREDKQPGSFTFVHITDDHSAGGVVENFGKNFPLMDQAVKFVVETGDLGYATAEGAEKMFSDIRRNGRTLLVPIFFVPGNHDYVGIHSTEWNKQHPLYGGGGYTKHLGPTRWSFDYAGQHFVGLDFATPHGNGKLEGGVPPIALDFLKRDLDRVKPSANVFAFMHYPDVPIAALQPDKFAGVYVFGGHSHQFAHWKEGKVVCTTQIALWGAGACGLVHVAGRDVDFVYRCAGCRWGDWKGMAQRGEHLGFCPLHGFAYRTLPAIEKVRTPLRELSEKPLAGSQIVEAGGNQGVQIALEIARGNARATGLRLHGPDRVLALEWDGTWLSCDGIRVPMPLREWEKSLRLRAAVQEGTARMQINGMYEFARPLKTGPLRAEVFATGGEATIKTFNVFQYDPGKLVQPKR